MSSASRARAWWLLLYGALFVWQIDRWCFTPHGLVSSWAHRPTTRAVAAASPRGIQQDFVMGADGLDGVWLETRPQDRTVHGDLVVDLLEVTDAGAVRLERQLRPASDVARNGRFHVPFRPVRASRGHRYRLDLRHLRAEPGPSLQLAVTRDDALRGASLFADGTEQWGDLVLETTSRRATLPFWIEEVLAPWPAWMRAPATVVTAILAMNLVLLWACARAAGLGLPSAPASERAGDPVVADRHRVIRVGTAAVLGLVTAGLTATLWPVPQARTVDLISALPDAHLETAWPSLHGAISPQGVVFDSVIRRSIVAMPPSRISWTVDVPAGAMFRGGAAMRPDMWARDGDGIQMSVTVEHARGRTLMTQLTLFPLGVIEHRKLFPVEVPLHPWAGQRITLTLEATPERWGNAVNDVPVWVEPRIEWPRRVAAVPPIVVPR